MKYKDYYVWMIIVTVIFFVLFVILNSLYLYMPISVIRHQIKKVNPDMDDGLLAICEAIDSDEGLIGKISTEESKKICRDLLRQYGKTN